MTPYYDEDGITIYHGDCREILPRIEPRDVSLVLTDPPYGIGYQGPNGETVHGDDAPFDPTPLLRFNRLILWGADNFASSLPPSRAWIVWEKRGGQDSTHSGLRVPDCELAWTNVAGRHRIYRQLWAGPLRSEGFFHPTQKSVDLMRWILDRYTEPGDLILDPYMGSGPVAQACHEMDRRYIGIEIEEKYCEIAVQRLAQGVLSFE